MRVVVTLKTHLGVWVNGLRDELGELKVTLCKTIVQLMNEPQFF